MNKKKENVTKKIFGVVLVIAMLVCNNGSIFNSGNFVVFAGVGENIEYSITEIINGQTPNENYITINNAEELNAFSSVINQGLYNDYYYKLTSNIELNENSENYVDWEYDPPANAWIPIGLGYDYPFAGVFDGQGFTISGLYINNTEGCQGLFGYMSSGIIKNVNLIDIYVKGGQNTGGLIGFSDGIVANCTVDGLVCSDFHEDWITSLGGIVGYNEADGEIVNCCNSSDVRGSGYDGQYYIGGIAGMSYGIVRNCYNSGGIVGGANYKGSIGHNDHGEGRYSRTNYWLVGTCGVYGKSEDCNQGVDDSFDENGLMLTQNNYYIEINWDTDPIPLSEDYLYEMLNAFVAIHNDFYIDDISNEIRVELKTWTPTALPTIAYNRSIVFNQDEGEFDSEYTVPTSYLEGTTLTLPTQDNISKEGYTFNGWTQHETEWDETTNPYITSITKTDLGNQTFYAKWSINKYTYTFYDEDGTTIIKQETVDYGTQIIAPSDPEKTDTEQYDFAFDGWYTEQTAGTKVDTFNTINESGATYYARYSFIEIEIENSLVRLWILIGVLGAAVISSLLLIFLYKRKVYFMLNDELVGVAKYRLGEVLNFPINLARFKWFTDKEETKMLTQQKMGWFGFTVYRNSKSALNAEKVKKS